MSFLGHRATALGRIVPTISLRINIFGAGRQLKPYHVSAVAMTKTGDAHNPRPINSQINLKNFTSSALRPTPGGTTEEGADVEAAPSSSAHLATGQQSSKTTLLETLPPTLQKFTLQGKVCVVTGGGRGLGLSMAQALAEVGARVVALLDINRELGEGSAADLHARLQVPVLFYQTDVREQKVVSQVVNDIFETYGSVDVLINAAGIADSNIKAEDYPPEKFRRLLDINVTGSFLVSQACGRKMIQTGRGGSIILIASMSGSIVNYPQEQCAYNASKAAVIQLGRSLAAEWAPHRIRVNSISPGYMDTELNRVPALEAQKKIWTSLTPQHRLGEVTELNGVAVWLASDASSFTTGANCVIDGGYSVY